IESVVEVSAVSGSVGSFANAKGATNLGAEVEFRQYLDPIHEALAGLYLAGNASFIWSRVDLGELEGNQTSNSRPLQGQSPYVVNGQLGYDLEATGTGITTVYNVFGPRIIEVGSSGIPDSYELPVHRLDLVISQELPAGFRVNLKASNLLDWPSRQRTGSAISEESREGWSAALGLRWDAPKKE
ncbi:MAG TPA: TonB-dependent receptor, partial [Myxococcota bacterium]|nr:TonB-dependent receptor [Myxococcota bacterium]